MIFASIWLILGVIRVKLESGNATRVRKLTQLTRVTQLELQALAVTQARRPTGIVSICNVAGLEKYGVVLQGYEL